MSLISRKIAAFVKKVANLPPKPGGTMPVADLQAQFDAAPEELRAALNGAIDDIIADYALKSELNGIVTGQLPDGSVTPAKLSFDVATQAELNAVLNGSSTFTGPITISKSSPAVNLKAQDSGHANEQINITHYQGELMFQDLGADGTWIKNLFRLIRTTGEAYLGNALIGRIEKGVYTGTGSLSRVIAVGFTPKYVYLAGPRGLSTSTITGWHLNSSRAIATSGVEFLNLKCVSNGFQVGGAPGTTTEDYANMSGSSYEWVAWG